MHWHTQTNNNDAKYLNFEKVLKLNDKNIRDE